MGHTLGLQAGDRLLRIDGRKVTDIIDYQFRITEESVILDIEKEDRIVSFDIEKDYDADLGVEFEEFKIRSCANDCVFCFVDQNPRDMRETLYFRDGDYRLSYLHGHYVTLTNMGQKDMERVVEQRLSPLYISVHATNPELRKKLFLYNKDDNLLKKLAFLADNGIEMHTQIVLMPEVNDGSHLQQTLQDIYQFFPILKSCSIVPVGLTGHRQDLMQLKNVTPEYAERFVHEFSKMRQVFSGGDDEFLFLSDEWYILAEHSFPALDEYDLVDVSENGVGKGVEFLLNFNNEKSAIKKANTHKTHFSIATGKLIHPIFEREVGGFLNSLPNSDVNIFPVLNDFMGHSVTVTGLLTGQDIIDQMKNQDLGEALWLSHRILNDAGDRTLDDLSLADISSQLGIPVNTSQDSILEIYERNIHG